MIPVIILNVSLNGGYELKYNSSCNGISFWEGFCKAGLSSGKVTLEHNGKGEDNETFYTRTYHVHLKATIHPAEVKFVYDRRNGNDKASGKVSIYDLILILEALINKEFNIDTGKFMVAMDKEDGFVITEK